MLMQLALFTEPAPVAPPAAPVNAPVFAHCACCDQPKYVALYCQWCGKVMCGECLADEWVDFPCYCGVDSETADWARDRYRKRLATLQRLGPAGLEQMHERRMRDRAARAEDREQWRQADPRELCACGHKRSEHGIVDGHPCYWSAGNGANYQDCECNAFTPASAAPKEAATEVSSAA